VQPEDYISLTHLASAVNDLCLSCFGLCYEDIDFHFALCSDSKYHSKFLGNGSTDNICSAKYEGHRGWFYYKLCVNITSTWKFISKSLCRETLSLSYMVCV